MRNYPPELQRAAKNLLDNNDFTVLFTSRMSYLERAVLDATDEKELLEAHAEYAQLRSFGEWVQMLGKETR